MTQVTNAAPRSSEEITIILMETWYRTTLACDLIMIMVGDSSLGGTAKKEYVDEAEKILTVSSKLYLEKNESELSGLYKYAIELLRKAEEQVGQTEGHSRVVA